MKKSNFVYFLFISKSAFLIIILLIATAMLNASIVSQTYRVDNPKLTVKEGYDYLELNNCAMTGTPTEPLLPYIQVRLLLPSGEEVFKVDVTRSGKVKVGEGYKIYPTQYDIPTSQAHLRKFTKPNEDIYSSDLAYPATAYRNYDTGYYRGHSIAYADVCPVEYIPKTGEVFYYTSVTVTLTTSYSDIASRAFRTRFRGDSDTEDYIKDLVQNPAMLSSYPVQNTTRQYYETDYLIITSNAYEECFESFAKFKKLQGYYTVTKTVESIYSNYTGVDNQDKIRNCIIDYYDNHGTDYVLLGGDVEIVPQRDLYGHTVTGDGPVYDNIPADLYYICLDRVGSGPGPDWNVDNDDKWGEYDLDDPILGDITEADFLAEMYIGRICADSETEFANALHKQIMYQKSPVAADNKKAIMVGEKLWDGLCGDEHKEQIRLGGTYDGYTTAGLANIGVVSQLQYASAYPDSTWPVQDLIDKMNSGATYINHVGHGNTYGYMKKTVAHIKWTKSIRK